MELVFCTVTHIFHMSYWGHFFVTEMWQSEYMQESAFS